MRLYFCVFEENNRLFFFVCIMVGKGLSILYKLEELVILENLVVLVNLDNLVIIDNLANLVVLGNLANLGIVPQITQIFTNL